MVAVPGKEKLDGIVGAASVLIIAIVATIATFMLLTAELAAVFAAAMAMVMMVVGMDLIAGNSFDEQGQVSLACMATAVDIDTTDAQDVKNDQGKRNKGNYDLPNAHFRLRI